MIHGFRIALIASLALVFSLPSAAEPLEWNLDNAHSYVGFKIRHLMVSWVRGQFTSVSGKVSFDKDDLSTLRIEIEMDPASIDTGNERRDNHLRSPDFFDVAAHPEMKFVSTKAEVADGKVLVTGDLTMHGVTKAVTLEVEGLDHVIDQGPRGQKTGATASAKLSRTDWGLTWNRAIEAGGVTVGDEVTLEIEAELGRGGASKKAGD